MQLTVETTNKQNDEVFTSDGNITVTHDDIATLTCDIIGGNPPASQAFLECEMRGTDRKKDASSVKGKKIFAIVTILHMVTSIQNVNQRANLTNLGEYPKKRS